MSPVSAKIIREKIADCRRLAKPESVISCLEELFNATHDGLAAYELGHEQEKIGKNQEAVYYYERAESLFDEEDYKNMARAAINNLQIEALLSEKKKKSEK